MPLTLVARRSSFSRSAVPLVAALAAHVAIALAVRAVPIGALAMRSAQQPAEPPREDVEVALEALPAPTTTQPDVPSPALVARPSSAESAAVTSRALVPVASAGAAAVEDGTTPRDGAPEAVASAGWFRPNAVVDLRPNLGALAPGSTHEGPDRAAPTPARPASTTGGLAEGLDAEDFSRGMGRGGPARNAVEEAARSGDAPTFGIVTFVIAIGADGKVNVDVASASSDRAGWEALSPGIRTALLGKAVRIAPKTRGVRVTVQVEASEQFPDGRRPPTPSKSGGAVKGSVGSVTETKDHVEVELPSVALTYESRNCSAGLVLHPGGLSAGAGCSPGVAMRVVSARIVREDRW